VETTTILSIWGASLSTVLGLLTIYERTRTRPIIRTDASIEYCRARETPLFVVGALQTGPFETDVIEHEIYVEFKAQNYGGKPLSLHHIYIEDAKGNLSYIDSEGLPIVLEAHSSATFMVQKEYFDDIDISTGRRVMGDVVEIGFVDALDRRYSVRRKRLLAILKDSLTLPTGKALFKRKDHPEYVVAAFTIVHNAVITHRSPSQKRSDRLFGLLRRRRTDPPTPGN
jgi:hypothetical protein